MSKINFLQSLGALWFVYDDHLANFLELPALGHIPFSMWMVVLIGSFININLKITVP